jgi:hypothetical protein
MSTTVGARIPALLFYISTFTLHHGPALPNLCKTVVSSLHTILPQFVKFIQTLKKHGGTRRSLATHMHVKVVLLLAHSGAWSGTRSVASHRPPTPQERHCSLRAASAKARATASTRPRAEGLPMRKPMLVTAAAAMPVTSPCPASQVASTSPNAEERRQRG